MFDRVEIIVRSGNGGYGAVSFRREKFVPFGGPDGGDGGAGGSVSFVADPTVTSLRVFKHKRYYRAGKGEPGKGKKKHGKKGGDLELSVPVGTVVSYKTQIGDNAVIGDLGQPGERVVVARGGRGGLGNSHFASATNQIPRVAEKGEGGEEKSIILELKLIADVGIIGYPNVGKSTLLAAASAAKPKIASYPFTTRSPVLGVVELGLRTFVLAEIPGLIDGAHLGRGLGHDFLRHITRTKVLIHLIDGTSPSPVEDMVRVNAELSLYDSALAAKRQLVTVNKTDLPEVQARLAEIEASFAAAGVKVFFISAATKEGMSGLMAEAMNLLGQITQQEGAQETPKKVFHPQPKVITAAVHKEDDTFVVIAPALERIVARRSDSSPGVRRQLKQQLQRLGITKALTKAGVKAGDRVRCGNFEWEWD
jgi:GTP-binding protein